MPATAQNALFIPFGQREDEVLQDLRARDYIREIRRETQELRIVAFLHQAHLYYYIDEDILYAVEDVRRYGDRKEAEHIVQTCMDFMTLDERRIRQVDSDLGGHHYATVDEERIIELHVQDLGTRRKPDIVVSLKVTSRLYGPRMQTEAFAARLIAKNL
ncbi:MAG: hypothetical protein OHK0039_23140 [Bacteroidia bacterium]